MMKGALILPKLNPMDIILESLRPTMDDQYEQKKIKEHDEIWKGIITLIPKRKER